MFREKPKSVQYTLGYFAGKEMSTYLPCLPTDHLKSAYGTVDMDEHDRLMLIEAYEKIDWEVEDSGYDEWKKLNNAVEDKYFPAEFTYHFDRQLPIDDMDQFCKGASDALWDSDICYYDCRPEKIWVDVHYPLSHTRITIKK